MWLVSFLSLLLFYSLFLMVFTKIKFGLLQVLIQCKKALRPRSDPSHSYTDSIYSTASVCIDRPALGFCWWEFFSKVQPVSLSTFLLYFWCLLYYFSLISSLHVWCIILYHVTTQKKQTFTFYFVKVQSQIRIKALAWLLVCRILIRIASVIFVVMCLIILQKYWGIRVFHSTLYHLSQPILQPQ